MTSIVKEDEDKNYLEISVEDTGVGIHPEDHSKLFQLFGFLDKTAEHNKQGIGLGLVIS